MEEQDLEVLLQLELPGRGHENNAVMDVETFQDAGLIDPWAELREYSVPYYGVVVTMEDGEEFQLTIRQHKAARLEEAESTILPDVSSQGC